MQPGSFSSIALLALIGTLLAVLGWALSSGIKQQEMAASSAGFVSQADVEMESFSFKQIYKGALTWDIQAKYAALFENRHEAELKEIQATLWTNNGLEVSFSGDRGLLNTETNDFDIRQDEGDLAVRMNNGFTIHAPSLIWREQRREITSDRPAWITGQGLRIHGGQLIVRLEDQQFTVSEDVHVTMAP